MYRNQLAQIRKNTGDLSERAARILAKRQQERLAETPPLPSDPLKSVAGSAAPLPNLDLRPEALGQHGLAEAIVLAELRPAFFVTNGGIDFSNAVEHVGRDQPPCCPGLC